MAALALAGITGMYLRQVKQIGLLGLLGYLLFGAGYLTIMSVAFVSRVRPALHRWRPTPAMSTTFSPRQPVAAPGWRHPSDAEAPSRSPASPTWLAASSSAARCTGHASSPAGRPRSSPSPALLTVTLPVLPDAFYRSLAFPNAIAMIGLGYSLWLTTRTETTTSRPLSTVRSSPRRVPNDPAPFFFFFFFPSCAHWCSSASSRSHRRVPPGAEDCRRPAHTARQLTHRRHHRYRWWCTFIASGPLRPSWARSSSPPGCAAAGQTGTAAPAACWSGPACLSLIRTLDDAVLHVSDTSLPFWTGSRPPRRGGWRRVPLTTTQIVRLRHNTMESPADIGHPTHMRLPTTKARSSARWAKLGSFSCATTPCTEPTRACRRLRQGRR